MRYPDKNVFVRGVVDKKLGNVTYIIQVGHQLWKRHVNQLYQIAKRHSVLVNTQPDVETIDPTVPQTTTTPAITAPTIAATTSNRVSGRSTKAPAHLADYVR